MKLIIILLLILSNFNLFGAELSYHFKNYNISDGLPSAQAYEVLQDSRGYIWITTDRGLVKYDGYKFEVLTVEDGLTTDVVFRLYNLPNGQIACYGKDRKIYIFDGDRFHLFLPSESLVDIVTTYANLLSFSINERGFSFSTTDRTAESVIHLEYETACGKFKVNRQEGLHISDNAFGLEIAFKGGEFSDLFFYNGKQLHFSEAPLMAEKFAYVVRSNGVIYFSLSQSLYRFDPKEGNEATLLMHFENTILSLKSDLKGNLLIGCREHGLWIIDTNHPKTKEQLIKDRSISSILIDTNDGIWVTTLYNGIYYCSDRSNRIVVLEDKEEKIKKLEIVDGEVFGLTSKHNLYKFCNSKIENVNVRQDIGFEIPKKSDYKLITLSAFGCIYDFRSEEFFRLKFNGRDFIEQDYYSYALLNSGVTKFTHNASYNYFMDEFTYSFEELGEDTMLIGTSLGLLKFSKNQLDFDSVLATGTIDQYYYPISSAEEYSPEEEFFKSKIRDIINIGDTLFIFGSAEKGIFIRELNKKDTWLTKKNGLISNSIDEVYFYNDRIVVVSNTGVSIVKEGEKIRNFTYENGLLSSFVFDALIYKDSLYVATDGGTSIFPLAQKKSDEVPIYLAEIKINGQVHDLKNEYFIEHNENELEISIDGLSFEQEGNINYKYQLKGVDQQWIESKSKTFRYSNLPSGEFIFEIKAKNYNKNWTTSVILFKLNKKQPFWESWFFLFSTLLLLVGLIWLLIWLVYRRKRRIEKDKIRILNLERKTLQAQMNPHFMFNSLNSLQALILKDKKIEAQEYLGEFARLTRLALTQSTKNSIRLHEEIAILKHYIELEKIRFSDSFKYEIIVKLKDQNSEISPMLIQPFVENAIIHGLANKKSDGKLKITFTERNSKTIHCIIEDNGSGREKNENRNKHKSLGISLVKERLDILLKEEAIHIEDLIADEQPIGTKVVLILPFNRFRV